MGIPGAEPGGHSSGVGTTDNHDLLIVLLHFSEEVGEVSKTLLRVQISQVLHAPVIEGLRVTIETVLEDEETSVVLGANHEGVEAGVGHGAPVLTADVEEDGA